MCAGSVFLCVFAHVQNHGCIAVINDFRQAVYGYDQRVEVFSSKGMISDGNDLPSTTAIMTVDGCRTEKPLWFFLERYTQAFIESSQICGCRCQRQAGGSRHGGRPDPPA